jgi:hypothetical protein
MLNLPRHESLTSISDQAWLASTTEVSANSAILISSLAGARMIEYACLSNETLKESGQRRFMGTTGFASCAGSRRGLLMVLVTNCMTSIRHCSYRASAVAAGTYLFGTSRVLSHNEQARECMMICWIGMERDLEKLVTTRGCATASLVVPSGCGHGNGRKRLYQAVHQGDSLAYQSSSMQIE